MFDSTTSMLVLDHLRVPYRIVDDQEVRPLGGRRDLLEHIAPSNGGGAALRWPDLAVGGPLTTVATGPGLVQLGGLTFYARVLPVDPLVERLRQVAPEEDWEAGETVVDTRGRQLGAVCRSRSGGVALPFDPNQVVHDFWTEGYRGSEAGAAARAHSLALRSYYRLRPLMPRPLQIALRRRYSRVQAMSRFPAWPLEESLHGFCQWLLDLVAEVASRPVPWIAPWPDGHDWALVLTHDVETQEGLRLLPVLREVEERRGYVSSWNFVPKRYRVPEDLLAELERQGCEIGIHGLYHDGRDLESAAMLQERLPEMTRFADQWGAVGFRSPATQREWGLIATLPFEYDSSYPDTDPFEPQKGGCCSWWPLLNHDVVELPITLAQDHTVFVILQCQDATVWTDKAEALRSRGGMALLITHPDYVTLGPIAESYDSLLARYAGDPTVWRALPREVSRWWRRRAASGLREVPGGWEVVGLAAADATVRFSSTHQEEDNSSSTTPR